MRIILHSSEYDRWSAFRLIKALQEGGAAAAALRSPDHAMPCLVVPRPPRLLALPHSFDISARLIDMLKGEVKSHAPAGLAETVAPLPQELRGSPAAHAAVSEIADASRSDDGLLLRMAQGAEAARPRENKLRGSTPISPTACAPARAPARSRGAPLVNLQKQIWKKAVAGHARASRTFRL